MNRKIKSTDQIPSHLVHQEGRQRGSLDQDALQTTDVELHTGVIHPECDQIVYAFFNKAGNKQRWETLRQAKWRKARNANRSLTRYHRTKQLKRDAK